MSLNRPPRIWTTLLYERDHQVCEELLNLCAHVCYSRCRGWPELDAEDLAHDALIKILELIDEDYTITSNFEGWVKVVTLRICIDAQRKVKRDRDAMAPLDDALEHKLSVEPGDAGNPHLAPLRAQLQECLKLLSPEQLQELEWRLQDHGPGWIAQQYNPPKRPNTVSVNLNRTIRKLKECAGGASGAGVAAQ